MIWAAFVLLVLCILAFDLGIFSRESKALTARAALMRTAAYFGLALLFTVFVYFAYEYKWFGLGMVAASVESGHVSAHTASHMPQGGWDAAAQFFMGYILEQSLSVDNIFVIALILSYFQVPAAYQHRVLLWGILGALVMRGIMIGLGVALIEKFDFMIYVFGALLIFTAVKMLFAGDEEVDFDSSRMVRLVRKFIRFHPSFVQDHFFTKVDGKWAMTPLFLALVIVETTDLVFAVDSIPAVIGLTRDPFLVFTSNVFAILGLRSLYFALADLLGRFHLLKYSLVAILALVGIKMLLHGVLPHDRQSQSVITIVSLVVITVALGTGIVLSLTIPPPKEKEHPEGEAA